jgi:hypothetical protein
MVTVLVVAAGDKKYEYCNDSYYWFVQWNKDPSPDIDNLYYPEQHTCTVELNRYHLKSIH